MAQVGHFAAGSAKSPPRFPKPRRPRHDGAGGHNTHEHG
jgi:hypothetical protein